MISSFQLMVAGELDHVRAVHAPMVTYHHAYGIIAEEFHEFEECVFKKSIKRSPHESLQELVQIAASCERAAYDLKLIT